MKKKLIQTIANSLIMEIPDLQRRVKEYYNDENDSLAAFLGTILGHLERLDKARLKGDMVGIYRMVSDSPTLEKSALGKDLYAFNDRLEELIRLLDQ